MASKKSRRAAPDVDLEAGRKRGPEDAASDLSEGKARKSARNDLASQEVPLGGRRLRVKLNGTIGCTRQMQAAVCPATC
jgi:hypothetical protein